MQDVRYEISEEGLHIAKVLRSAAEVLFVSRPYRNREDAQQEAETWNKWFESFPGPHEDSIYYILAVPLVWPGPPQGGHRYSGLHFKIGRTTDILKRYQNLRTGTSDNLIIHALQPGDAKIEAEIHRRFESDRRQGEWFAASRTLCEHVLQTWTRNRILPPEHQKKVVEFAERSSIYASLNHTGHHFDMINPSLNDEWHGSVFVDLVYTSLIRK